MKTFDQAVADELKRARSKHKDIQSPHEAYAVILEELEEFWDEVKAQVWDRSKMVKELVQVGAMAQRAAEDLKLDMDLE